MNDFQASVSLLHKLNFEDVSEKGGGSLIVDLQFKSRFNKGFIYLGVDNEKLSFAQISGLTVSSTAENIARINQINDILTELFEDAKCQKWLGK